jgi:ABC-type nitrate/sulfonate/bicarbonate transport system substrate-binding protein
LATNRAVITGKDTPYKSVSDLRGKTIGVSRMGSGSQIFASYMALREKWFSDEKAETVEPLDFKGRQVLYEAVSLLANTIH